MKTSRVTRRAFSLAFLFALLLAAAGVMAQIGGAYDLSWNTVDGGGGISQAGDTAITGAIGQCDAGQSEGGTYSLHGGFLTANPTQETAVSAPWDKY